ncbi:MAG: NYN domain-containing protein [Microbispora sp.]|nr:NYN domain-containing protein [Microbispora sp.]
MSMLTGSTSTTGCLRGTPYKWLDLDALAHRLVRQGSVHRIRYFTARVTARPDDPGAHKRQDTYLRALRTIPHLTVHFGRFQERITRMPPAFPTPGSPRTVEVVKTEEKGSDVNLATYLLLDAFRRDCDSALVVSNDADLAEPIRVVRHELGVPIGVANPYPYERRAIDLIAAPHVPQADQPEHVESMSAARPAPSPREDQTPGPMVRKHRAPSDERGSGPPIEMSGAVANSKQDRIRARQLTLRNAAAPVGPALDHEQREGLTRNPVLGPRTGTRRPARFHREAWSHFRRPPGYGTVGLPPDRTLPSVWGGRAT